MCDKPLKSTKISGEWEKIRVNPAGGRNKSMAVPLSLVPGGFNIKFFNTVNISITILKFLVPIFAGANFKALQRP